MTMYHRGKKRSVYRKRDNAKVIQGSGVGDINATLILAGPPNGSTLIKSVRGRVLVPAVSSPHYASGWVGYARYANQSNLSKNYDLAESEVFGVQPWVIGNKTDNELALDLKGITLTKDESWWLVGHVNFASASFNVGLLWQAVYAEHEMPA